MSKTFPTELATALAAVRLASGICRAVQNELTTDALSKKDRSPVTIADYASQAVICRALRTAFPTDPIVAEEDAAELRLPENEPFRDRILEKIQQAGQEISLPEILDWIDEGSDEGGSSRFWTLDPIDGTKGFLRKEQFAVSLALIVDGQIALGVLCCPQMPVENDDNSNRGVLFYAVRGAGAFSLPLEGTAEPQPIHVSSLQDSAAARVCESVESGHSDHSQAARILNRLGVSGAPVRMDSQAKYAAVARGDAELYLRLPTRADYSEKIWDHAGGVLIVEEAGGRVTDITGAALDFTRGKTLSGNRGVLVSNALLHDEALAALTELFPA